MSLDSVKTDYEAPAPEINDIRDEDIPISFDSRIRWHNCTTLNTIRQQANCGSCWAVSSASVMSDRICIATNAETQIQVSAIDIVSCCEDCYARSEGCQGADPRKAMKFWQSHGVVTGGEYRSKQDCKPYTFGNPILPERCNETAPQCRKACSNYQYSKKYAEDKYYASNSYKVMPFVTAIQKKIMTYGPVVAGFDQYADFNTYCSGYFRIIRGVDECGFESNMVADRPKI